MNKEDNPVPSLDIDKLANEYWETNKKNMAWIGDLEDIKDAFKAGYNLSKQNGVENANEQPCIVCNTKTSRVKNNSTIHICIDCAH